MSDDSIVEVLLVEDGPQDMELALRAFKKAHVSTSIKVVRDGAEALDFVFAEGQYSVRNIGDVPQVILLDLKLPKIDGLEVLKRLKEDPRSKSIPVVVLPSSNEQRDMVESYRLGVNRYVVKPVNFESFFQAMRDLGMYWLLFNQPPQGRT